MHGYLELKTGFDADTAERIARALGGAVAVHRYGPSRELSDWSAWVPCPREEQSDARADAEQVAGRRLQVGVFRDRLPYGTRAVWDTLASDTPAWK